MDRRVLLDANVLWSPQQRNIVLQMALKLDLALHWTALIIEEWLRNVTDRQREQCEQRTLPLMDKHFPQAQLPAMPSTPYGRTDPKDRHVATAAVSVAPATLVTWNIRDFDAKALNAVAVAIRTPDQFLTDLYDRYPELVAEAAQEAQVNLSRSAPSWSDYLEVLSRNGLDSFVGRLAGHPAREKPDGKDAEDGSDSSSHS